MSKERQIYEFDEFRLDVDDITLWRGPDKFSLPLKAVEMLALLIENRGRTVTKKEILEKLWQNTFVDENNLAVMVSALRKAFGETSSKNRFIETVPRRGYRFVGEVKVISGNPILEKPTVAEITSGKTAAAKSNRTRNILISAGLAFLLTGILAYWFWNPAPQSSEKTPVSSSPAIAVLPFRPTAKDHEQLSITLTDALITKLAGLKGLTVRPTSSVLAFAQNPPTPRIVQEKLRVENYLEGTIQKMEDRLRVSVQLVKTADGSIVWAGNFDEAETDLLKLQDAISDQVVTALRFKISPQEQEVLAKRGTENDEAFRFYLQGRYFWNKRSIDGLKKSLGFYEKALSKDAAYAMAYVGLADSYQILGEYGAMLPQEAFEKARAAAKKALELNPDLGEAYCSLGYTQAFYDWNWNEAGNSFNRALELSPNYSTLHQWYGEYLLAVGKSNESFAELKKAQELDPLSLIIAADIAAYYYTTRQFDKAIEQSLKINEIDETFFFGYVFLWISYEQNGMLEASAKALLKADSLYLPSELVQQSQSAYQKDGWKGLWQTKYNQTIHPATKIMFNDYQRAVAAFRVGDVEATFRWLQKSGEAKNRWFVNLKYDPEWDKIRNDPRFDEMVRKTNLIP
ncbi:MAG: winged helix-turn-helix domain-containing protein [Acidobacteria bacterium]|nr:winged helix-turn-helix domain-containing protein [Acidobacteriota bacterium]